MELVVVIIALVLLMAFQEFHGRRERSKLINAILSKDAKEFQDMELADKTSIKVAPKDEVQDFISTDQLSDDDWEKAEIRGEKIKWPIK
jgi:hypothetical protein